jgi:glycosyl transferase family 15 (putative glycolipid 2-alpha-mannosyltransferase)
VLVHARATVRSLINTQLALLSLTLYAPQEYNVNSITTLISTHKGYHNLLPAILTEGEERDEISGNTAAAQPSRHLANATLFMLARNSEVDNAVNSVLEVEDRFNRKYGYPWVFLNEEPFSDDFKRCAARSPLLPAAPMSRASVHLT